MLVAGHRCRLKISPLGQSRSATARQDNCQPMSMSDHYFVLGVLPTADDVVLRAAYRALAQRYHPDKWQGEPSEASEKMAQINAAYAVLSDPASRRAYDESRSPHNDNAEAFFSDEDVDREPMYDPLEADWRVAVDFYPDLAELEKGLGKLSWRVAFAYRAMMLETQDFQHRTAKAEEIRNSFLRRHFGENRDILELADALISQQNRKAAVALNRAVRVLGAAAESERIISTIVSSECPPGFQSPMAKRRAAELRMSLQKKRKTREEWGCAVILIALALLVALVAILALRR